MSKKERISVRQVTVLMFMCLIGDMLLIYPTMITHIAHQDAWISSILSIPLGLIIIYVLIRVHELYCSFVFMNSTRALHLLKRSVKFSGPYSEPLSPAGICFIF
ncbi:GerAB/ArcD/ProY family transporter [Paenibacillus polymyxa]|uniref:GerAB/ArcD/ProY family transporter n=1 Tax=Paenibacillus polymyxa TaxID=1406 RepID=UPI000A405014|nr:GerAB/ArcD/ProY family transporter [Paenibacillus polymyxa]